MLRSIDMTMDATDGIRLAEFWKTAVGYVDEPPPAPFASRSEWLASYGEDVEEADINAAWLIDPRGVAPRLSILPVPEPKTAKNRLHLDLRVSDRDLPPAQRWDQVRAEAARLVAAGATVVAEFDGAHIVMADPEGNEFCVA